MLPFREITLEDKPMVEHCGSHYNYHLCERCFVDLFMWRSHYNTQICFKDGFMLVKMSPLDGGHECYLAPVGQGDLGAALDALEQDAAERGLPFVIVSVAEPMIERIEAVRPGKFTFSHDSEDGDDYIYLADKLRTLSGKKLQSKRNLVNRFKAAYEGRWSYEDMTRENIKDAFAFHIHWCNLNGCARERDFEGETCAIVQALHNFDYLNLRGGLLRLDGEVIAFTFGFYHYSRFREKFQSGSELRTKKRCRTFGFSPGRGSAFSPSGIRAGRRTEGTAVRIPGIRWS